MDSRALVGLTDVATGFVVLVVVVLVAGNVVVDDDDQSDVSVLLSTVAAVTTTPRFADADTPPIPPCALPPLHAIGHWQGHHVAPGRETKEMPHSAAAAAVVVVREQHLLE